MSGAILDALPTAIIVAAPDRRFEYANRAGEDLLRTGTILRVANGRIAAVAAEAQARFQSAFEAVCQKADEPSRIIRLQAPAKMAFFATVMGHVSADGRQQVLVMLKPPRRGAIAEQMKDLFGLTKTEADLAVRLADGFSLSEVAEARGIRLSTARAQLRSVLTKLDCTRQARLVAMIGSMTCPYTSS